METLYSLAVIVGLMKAYAAPPKWVAPPVVQQQRIAEVVADRGAEVDALNHFAARVDERRLQEAEDRQRHGLLLDSPLWENRMLGHQTRPPSVKGFWLDPKGARGDSERIVGQYDVRTPGIDTTARALSGGNQQKFIVGREMSGEPILLMPEYSDGWMRLH